MDRPRRARLSKGGPTRAPCAVRSGGAGEAAARGDSEARRRTADAVTDGAPSNDVVTRARQSRGSSDHAIYEMVAVRWQSVVSSTACWWT